MTWRDGTVCVDEWTSLWEVDGHARQRVHVFVSVSRVNIIN